MSETYLGTQNLMHGSDSLDSLSPIARRAYSAPAQAAEKAYSRWQACCKTPLSLFPPLRR